MPKRAIPRERGGRDAILAAAIALFDEEGADGFTARAVAARAGITATAIYRHFSDLGALHDEVLADGWRRFGKYLARGARLADPMERLRATGDGYLRFVLDHPAIYRALFLQSAQTPGGRRGGFPLLVQRIADCQRAGLLPVGDTDTIALTLWSSVHGLAALHLSGHLGGSDRAFLARGRGLVRMVTRLRPETSHPGTP